jgi:phosphoribosyl 1,2-cyclic phosphodiesterase
VRVASLGSGSSGNAVLIQSRQTAVLVDAGFGSRALTSRLRQVGVATSAISAILLTHEHSDHACGARAFARLHGIPLVSDPRTLRAVMAQPENTGALSPRSVEREELPVGQTTRIHDLDVRSFTISHDAVAPCGYRLSTSAWSVVVVTDTGEAQAAMIEAMRGGNLLVIEANHDKERLLRGPYPYHLKRRILSPTGHLSNEQTSQALVSVLDDGPRWVWLAHLSRTNNTPDLARASVRDYLRERGFGHVQLQVAPPDVGPVWDSTALWDSAPAQQGLWANGSRASAAVAPAPAPDVAPVLADAAPDTDATNATEGAEPVPALVLDPPLMNFADENRQLRTTEDVR